MTANRTALGARQRGGRRLAAIGAVVVWLPFAALTVLSILVALSGPGLGEGAPISLVGLVIVIVVPTLTWLAFRAGSVVAAALLIVPGVAIPLVWAWLLRPDHSEPLHLITRLAIIGGAGMVLGGLLMLRRPSPGQVET